MPATLTPKAEELFDDLPPYFGDDPLSKAILGAVAKELERIDEFLSTLREKMRPSAADDEYGLLGLWEARVGLPVEPEGVSVENRREKVLAVLRRGREGAGSGWVDMVSAFLGTTAWVHEEQRSGDYRLAIDLPPVSVYTEEQTMAFIAQTVPAHLLLDAAIEGVTFQVGISAVGDEI